MKKLLELEVDENGNFTLEGNIIKVKPLDTPFVVPEDVTLRENGDVRKSFLRSLNQTWNPPKDADAYTWSGTNANSYNNFERYFWAVQAYKFMEERK